MKTAIEALAELMGEQTGKLERRIVDLEARLAASDQASVELLLELERRLAALEARQTPDRPKLTVIDDAAA
jgi:BMFP domain-containing protein YqiC